MNITQLHETLKQYCNKDKKYTIFAMTFYSIVFGSIAVFLGYASSIKSVSTKMTASDNPMSNLKIPFFNFPIFQNLPYIILAGLGIYVLFNIIQLLNKPKKIDAFITHLQIGQPIKHFTEHDDYKLHIRIPGLIKMKLLPIQYGMIQFADKKTFYIPLPGHATQAVKHIASGADYNNVSDAWQQIEK
jgi:hypothetical protein